MSTRRKKTSISTWIRRSYDRARACVQGRCLDPRAERIATRARKKHTAFGRAPLARLHHRRRTAERRVRRRRKHNQQPQQNTPNQKKQNKNTKTTTVGVFGCDLARYRVGT